MNRATLTSPLAPAALTVVVALLLAVGPPPATAAPPSPDKVIARAVAASPDRLASTQVTYLEVPRGDAPPRVLLRISVGPEGQLREDLQDLGPGGGTVVRIWAPAPAGAPPPTGPIDAAPAWLRLLVGHPVEGVLQTMGVDTTRVAFALDGRELLWVLGAGPQSPDAPQIHLAAATGQLRRVTERVAVVAGAEAREGAEIGAAASVTVHLSAPRVFVVDAGADAADADDADRGSGDSEAPPAPIEVSSAPWPERITFLRPGLPPLVLALHRTTTDAARDPDLFVPEAVASGDATAPADASDAPSPGWPPPANGPAPRGGGHAPSAPAPSVPAPTPLDL